MAINAGTAIAYLTLDSTKFQSGFKTAKQHMDTFKNDASTTQDKIKAVGGVMTSVGGTLTKSVSLPLAGVGAAALKAGVSFEQGMAQVKAISGATGKDFDKLRDKAMEMGAKTKFSASESAEAMNYMAMAGWKTEDMLQGIEPIMNLAAASGEDLGRTSDIVTDALTAFGMSAKDTTRFVDVMSATMANSNTDVNMLGESFKYVAPVAGTFGYSVEDVGLALGLMANSGIKATQSGNSLKTIMSRLAKPTKETYEAMDRLGISLDDGQGNMKPFRQILEEMRGSFGNLMISEEEFNERLQQLNGDLEAGAITQKEYDERLDELTRSAYGAEGAEKARVAAMLAGREAMPGLMAMINASESDYNKLASAIDNSKGATQEMVDIMMNTLQGAFDIFKSTLETAGIQISDVLIPIVREFAEWLTKIVEWFTKLPKPVQEFIIKIGMLAVAIGPILSLGGNLIKTFSNVLGALGKVGNIVVKVAGFFGKIPGVFGNVISIAGKLGGALKLLWGLIAAHPFVAIGAAIAAVIGYFVNLYHTNEDFRKKVNEIWDSIKKKVGEFADTIGEFFTKTIPEFFEGFGEKTKDIGKGIGEFFSGVIEDIKKIPESIVEFGKDIREKIDGFFADVHENINLFFNDIGKNVLEWVEGLGLDGVFGEIVGKITNIFMNASGIVQGFFNSVTETVSAVVQTVIAFFTGDLAAIPEIWSEWWTEISENVAGAIEGIKTIFTDFVEIGKELFNGFLEFLGGIFDVDLSEVFGRFGETITGIWDSVKTFFTETLPEVFGNFSEITLADFIEGCKEWFNKLPENLGYAIGFAIGKVVAFGEDLIKNGKEYAKKFVEETIKFVKELPGKIKEWLDKTVEKVKYWGKNTVKKAKETWRDFKKEASEKIVETGNKIRDFSVDSAKKFEDWKKDTDKKAKEGWANIKKEAKEGVENALEKTKTFVENSKEKFKDWKNDTDKKSKEGWANIKREAKEGVENALGKIKTFVKDSAKKFKDWKNDIAENSREGLKSLKDNFVNGIKEIPSKIKETVGKIPEIVKNMKNSFKNAGSNLINWFLSGINSAAKHVWEWINEFLKNVGKAFSDFVSGLKKGFSAGKNGSHAGGLTYVPFDGYMAELHRGERVLTKREAEEYNKGNVPGNTGGDTFNFYNTKPDPYTYYRQMKRAKRELLYNM